MNQENKKIDNVSREENEETIDREQLKKKSKMYILDFLIIIAIFVLVFHYVVRVDGIENIQNVLKSVDYKWVIAGLICLIGMWIAESITLYMPLKKIYPTQTFTNAIKITMIGQLFNNLTPFASGGQLMQAYELTKTGKRASDSLSVLAMKFVITQTTLIIFTLVVVISQFKFFAEAFKDYLWIGIAGILINVIVVIVFFLAGNNKNFIMKIARPTINFLGKLHIGKIKFIKDPKAKLEKFDSSVENFSAQFNIMKKQRNTVISMTIIGLIQSILYYAITYMIYRAFGNYGTGFLQIITIQAFLMLIMTITPTPGAGLGAEGGFLILFGSIFKNGTINMSILFWRIYVFYLPIIVGALFMIPTGRRLNKRKKLKIK